MALWNCQSAVNKADLIPLFLYNPHSASWAWLRPGFVQKTPQPQLPSLTIYFSLTPLVRLAGVGALVCSFQIIGNTQPTSPMQLQLIWISCDYCNSSYKILDCGNLPSPWPNYSPLPRGAGRVAVLFHGGWHSNLVFGDFNIHLEKPYATDFHSLLASFDLKRLTTTSTHKSGNQLDLIYTRDCTADNILVQPLHISDHFFIKFTLHFATRVPPTPLRVTFRRNLRSLSPSHFSSVVSSSLPSPTHFSSLDVNAATDTLCSTLTSCLDDICLLSLRPARTAPSNPWLSDVLREHRTRLRAAEKMAKIKSVGPEYVSIVAFIFLRRSPHCQIVTFP